LSWRGKTLASYEKMSERDVKNALDKRMQRIRHDATRVDERALTQL